MKKIGSLIHVSLKNNLQSLPLVVTYFITALVVTFAIGAIGVRGFIDPIVKSGKATPQLLGYIIGILAYSTMLIVTGINFCILFSVPLTREKVRGNIESAMAAAIHPKTIWFAKSAALFISGVVTGYVFAFGLTQIIQMLFIPPAYGVRMSMWIILCIYLCVPIAYFALSLLMNLVGMIGRAMDGGVIGVIFTAGMTTLMIQLAARKTVDAGSWPFLLVNFLLAVLLFAISSLFEKKLQPERIVLSCKE